MNQHDYDLKYGFSAVPSPTFSSTVKKFGRNLHRDYLTRKGLSRTVERRIPALKWIRQYDIKDNLASDVLAGITVGIYNIPQGLAYSVLASLPPVFGLYASFFPPLFYFLLGSSFHSSIGVFSLTCLMVGHARTDILPDYANGTTATEYKGIENLTPVDVVVALAFMTGAIQLLMAVFRLDFLTSYLSDPAVSGLNFGAACHALVSQLPGILGISTESNDRTFLKLFYSLGDIIMKVPDLNVATTIISVVTITILLLSKTFIEPRFKKLGFPFPSELAVMIGGTVISSYAKLHQRWDVDIIDHIPLGMPAPRVPRFQLMPYLIDDAISIAIVAYAVTVSMGKLFARKHRYTIDTNQELLALGTAGCLSSFFSVFPTSTSLSRTLVNEESGAKTQLSGLVSATIILSVIFFLGPFLEALPMCMLCAIVTVALRSLLKKITEVPRLWNFSKLDVVVWISTATITICYNIVFGLVGGMLVALFLIIIQTQWPELDNMGEVAPSDYRVLARYASATPTKAKVLRFDAPLIFTNVECFKRRVRRALRTELEPQVEKPFITRVVILDCSTWTYTDSMGVEAIRDINEEFLNQNTLLMFADLKSYLRIQYAKAGLFAKMNEDQFYPSVKEALIAANMLYHRESEQFRETPLEDPAMVLVAPK